MLLFPHIKINLGLSIIGKRSDGFHNLESIFYPVQYFDCIEIHKSDRFQIKYQGLQIPGNADDNLCQKAYKLMLERYDIPCVELTLLKHIPMGAGLGGGSSNGAFTISAINSLFNLGLGKSELEALALELGSDCPYFITSGAKYVQGRGEILEDIPLNLKGIHITMVMPGIHITTGQAFAYIKPQPTDIPLTDIITVPINNWISILRNDFEDFAFSNFPELQTIKQELYNSGADYCQMSGSGSTIFALSAIKLNINKSLNKYPTWQGILD